MSVDPESPAEPNGSARGKHQEQATPAALILT